MRGMRAAGARSRSRTLGLTLAAALALPLLLPLAAGAVIGGRPAEPGTYPWLAHITDSLRSVETECTGTVVAPRLILTAAHCVVDSETGELRDPSGFSVVTGNVDWARLPRQVRKVGEEALAPGYEPRTGVDDVALLVLAQRTSAPPISLARPRDDARLLSAGTAAWLVGWGDTRYGQSSFTADLHEAETALQEPAWCGIDAPLFSAQAQLCVIDPPRDATTTCAGDSGGPLIVGEDGEEQREEEWIDVGVLSGGFGHCESTEPSIYTRVDALYPWIHGWVARLRGASATRLTRAGRRGRPTAAAERAVSRASSRPSPARADPGRRTWRPPRTPRGRTP